MRVLFVAAEAVPWAKTGGLADVVGALPPQLAALGIDVAVLLPKYRTVASEGLEVAGRLRMPWRGQEVTCTVWGTQRPQSSVPVYFLDYPAYFDRTGIYGEGGQDYPDALERFSFLAWAALHLASVVGWHPDLIHVHDWHAALVPVFVQTTELAHKPKTVLTIHNLAYAGWFPPERWAALGLPTEVWELVRGDGWGSALLGGIRAADCVTTVSPSYAREVLQEDHPLAAALKAKADRFVGILNGIDPNVWDPRRDPYLAPPWRTYSPADLAGKQVNKRLIQQALGLIQGNAPLVVMISRLVEQKGVDLVVEGFDRLMALGVQLVVLGTGEARWEEAVAQAAQRYSGQAAVLLEYSEAWAHRLLAGADMLLMPSRFEPCGLTQLYALRYGTVPIVRATGGLKDTIRDCETFPNGNGFAFEAHAAEALLGAVGRAVRMYGYASERWAQVVRRGMGEDHSWTRSAQRYVDLYHRVANQGNVGS